MSAVTIKVGGKALTGWESVDIFKSMTSLCGSFSLAQSATNDNGVTTFLPVFPGDKVTVELDGVPFMTGWVDKISPKVDGKSHSIGVEGREITCDLVDCSRDPKTPGHWKNLTLPQLIRELASPFGLSFKDTGAPAGSPFKLFSAEPGDSIFETIRKAATVKGVLPMTLGDGSITTVVEGKKRATDRLVYGVNILSASGSYDNKSRFSEYHVTGQAPAAPGSNFFGGAKKHTSTAGSTDPLVTRYRPLVIVESGEVRGKAAQSRANWEAVTRAAKASTVEITVRGWIQSDGTLWECARVASVEVPYLFGPGSRDLLISSVRYSYGPGGTVAVLSLVTPGAFTAQPENKKAAVSTPDAWASVRKAVKK